MKYGFDEKRLQPSIRLEDKDLADALEIKKMMQTKGWKILKNYWSVERDELIAMEDKWALDKEKIGLLNQLVAKRGGYDYGTSVADLVVMRADKFLERQFEEEKQAQSQLNLGGELR